MPQIGDQLGTVLALVAARRRLALGLTRTLRAAWALAGALGALIVLDAALRLPAGLRAGAAVTLLTATAAALVALLVLAGRWRARPVREAWALERAHHLAANPLVAAVQLRPAAAGAAVGGDGGPLQWTAALAERAVALGEAAAGAMDRRNAVDWSGPRVELQRLLAVLACFVVLGAVQPTLLGAGVLRLVDPFGDHPPFGFTRVAVAVEPGPDEVVEGDDVRVRATLRGRAADRAWLVELDEQGREVRRLPLRAGGAAGEFDRTLAALREPVTLRVEAGDGRSRRVTLMPRPRPAEPAPDAGGAEPEGEGEERADADPSTATDGEGQAASDLDSALGYLQREDPALAERVAGLVERVSQLHRDAQELQRQAEQAGADFDWDRWAARVSKLDGDLADAAAVARAVAEAVRGKKDGAPPALRQPLEALAKAVESMGVCTMGACPNPGAQGEPTGQGQGQGAGVSGRGLGLSPLSGWLATLQQVAAADALRWSEALGLHGFTVAPATRLGDQPSQGSGGDAAKVPLATGRSDEDRGVATGARAEVEAVASKAPPRYRDLVRRYFNRVGAPGAAAPVAPAESPQPDAERSP